MKTNMLTTQVSDSAQAEHLTAFCARCPDAREIERLLRTLGFRQTLFLPAERGETDMPPLPAQYHFEDAVGTSVIFLAGPDTPSLADEEEAASRPFYRYPPHCSRFWLTAGGQALVTRRVRDTLTRFYLLRWQDARLVDPQEEVA